MRRAMLRWVDVLSFRLQVVLDGSCGWDMTDFLLKQQSIYTPKLQKRWDGSDGTSPTAFVCW